MTDEQQKLLDIENSYKRIIIKLREDVARLKNEARAAGSGPPVNLIANRFAGRTFTWAEAASGALGRRVCGIYAIHIRRTDGTLGAYVGRAMDIASRWQQHVNGFNTGEHCQVDIVAECQKLGGTAAFSFIVLEEIVTNTFLHRQDASYFEQWWINDHRKRSGVVYNLRNEVSDTAEVVDLRVECFRLGANVDANRRLAEASRIAADAAKATAALLEAEALEHNARAKQVQAKAAELEAERKLDGQREAQAAAEARMAAAAEREKTAARMRWYAMAGVAVIGLGWFGASFATSLLGGEAPRRPPMPAPAPVPRRPPAPVPVPTPIPTPSPAPIPPPADTRSKGQRIYDFALRSEGTPMSKFSEIIEYNWTGKIEYFKSMGAQFTKDCSGGTCKYRGELWSPNRQVLYYVQSVNGERAFCVKNYRTGKGACANQDTDEVLYLRKFGADDRWL